MDFSFIQNLGIEFSPVVAVIVFGVALAVKAKGVVKDTSIPAFCGIFGGVIAPIGFYVMPNFPASDPMSAIACGVVSGFVAVGAHQVYKQGMKAKQGG